jgi:hypothetical protein
MNESKRRERAAQKSALALAMKNQEASIPMNDLFRMKEKPRNRGSLDGEIGGKGQGLTKLANAIPFPSFLLFLSGKEFGELHRQVP